MLILEQTELYQQRAEHRLGDLDHHLLPGRARVVRAGTEVTVLTYLNMVGESVAAAADTGIDAEVVDLRWLDRASLDWDTVGASIRRTGRVMIAEQGSASTAYGAWLGDEIQRRFHGHLTHPVERVAGGEASPTISRVLERAAIARREEVGVVLRRCVAPLTVTATAPAGSAPDGPLGWEAEVDATALMAFHGRVNSGRETPVPVTALLVKAAGYAVQRHPGMPRGTGPDVAVVGADGGTRVVRDVPGRSLAGCVPTGDPEVGEPSHRVMVSWAAAPGLRDLAPRSRPPAVLALTAQEVRWRPAVVDGEVVPRQVLTIALHADARAVDAIEAARWFETVAQGLAARKRP